MLQGAQTCLSPTGGQRHLPAAWAEQQGGQGRGRSEAGQLGCSHRAPLCVWPARLSRRALAVMEHAGRKQEGLALPEENILPAPNSAPLSPVCAQLSGLCGGRVTGRAGACSVRRGAPRLTSPQGCTSGATRPAPSPAPAKADFSSICGQPSGKGNTSSRTGLIRRLNKRGSRKNNDEEERQK